MVDFLYTWLFGDWIQFIGFLTGAGAVFFLARNKGPIGWVLGVINAVFFTIMFFGQLLLADVLLNLYYFFTSAAGFVYWIKLERDRRRGIERKVVDKATTITHLDRQGWLRWAGVWIVATLVMGFLLDNFTNADIAYLDSFTTVGSLIAQFLLVKKVFENWYMWIFVDVIDIGIYSYKGLFPVVTLTVIYMVLCIMGLRVWTRDEQGEATEAQLRLVEAGAAG